ncbi:hypothetical protein Tco_0121547 [Tanacetum coccineum]
MLANISPAVSSSSSHLVAYCMREGLVKKKDFTASADKGNGHKSIRNNRPHFHHHHKLSIFADDFLVVVVVGDGGIVLYLEMTEVKASDL